MRAKGKMMTVNTIEACLAGSVAALSLSRAQLDLQQAWPIEGRAVPVAARAVGPVSIPAGERFGVSSGVAVVPLRGILTPDAFVLERYLGWATYQGFEQTCEQLAGQDDVRAVVVPVHSPGGLVMGLEAAAAALAALKAVKPVHALVDPMAASAAYYIASQATDITMTPGAELGSIGTMRMSEWPVQPGMSGNQRGVHVSSHARGKYPDPTQELGQAEIRRSLDLAEAAFLDAVAAGRGLDRAGLTAALSVTDDPADGGVMYHGADAIQRGLADHVKPRSEFYAGIFEAYGPKPQQQGARALSCSARARAALAKAKI